jgi:hypothetical protein
MRLGQKNGLVRQWARTGTRPRQPKDQRYESADIFGALRSNFPQSVECPLSS